MVDTTVIPTTEWVISVFDSYCNISTEVASTTDRTKAHRLFDELNLFYEDSAFAYPILKERVLS